MAAVLLGVLFSQEPVIFPETYHVPYCVTHAQAIFVRVSNREGLTGADASSSSLEMKLNMFNRPFSSFLMLISSTLHVNAN